MKKTLIFIFTIFIFKIKSMDREEKFYTPESSSDSLIEEKVIVHKKHTENTITASALEHDMRVLIQKDLQLQPNNTAVDDFFSPDQVFVRIQRTPSPILESQMQSPTTPILVDERSFPKIISSKDGLDDWHVTETPAIGPDKNTLSAQMHNLFHELKRTTKVVFEALKK